MQFWIWSAAEENWNTVKSKQIWATYRKNVTTKIEKGDIFIFYVRKSLSFKGIFKAVSDWYKTNKLVWEDEIVEKNKKYPYQIDIAPILLGEANYQNLVPKLKFVKMKDRPQLCLLGTHGGPANFGKPIEKLDYELILNEMKGKQLPPPPPQPLTHSELSTMLVDLGTLFGKHPEKEHRTVPYTYDVVWKEVTMGNPTKVFEVHDKGVLDSALSKLKHAYDIWHADLFLVVTRHKDKEKAKLLLGGTFHGIEGVTTLIQPEEIKDMHEYKRRFNELERKLR